MRFLKIRRDKIQKCKAKTLPIFTTENSEGGKTLYQSVSKDVSKMYQKCINLWYTLIQCLAPLNSVKQEKCPDLDKVPKIVNLTCQMLFSLWRIKCQKSINSLTPHKILHSHVTKGKNQKFTFRNFSNFPISCEMSLKMKEMCINNHLHVTISKCLTEQNLFVHIIGFQW